MVASSCVGSDAAAAGSGSDGSEGIASTAAASELFGGSQAKTSAAIAASVAAIQTIAGQARRSGGGRKGGSPASFTARFSNRRGAAARVPAATLLAQWRSGTTSASRTAAT